MEDWVVILVLLVALVLMWAVMNQRTKQLVLQTSHDASVELATLRQQLESESQRSKERSQHETELTKEREKQMQQQLEQLKEVFSISARNAFDEVVKKSEEDKESSFKGATAALQKNLESFTENINRFERESIERDTNLKNEINAVSNLGIRLSEDTQSLTRALKADAQAQGAWGELVLENLLQSMGFVEGKDYDTQISETSADGTRKRTDFIVYLPDNRQVIIDSKVSLTAWERYVNAESEEEAEQAMKDHCKSIENHAKTLASKRYQDMQSVHSVEFVLMFVPLESAFGAAMRQSPELYMDLAGNVNVKVVTGATIVTALLLIKDLWKRELQSRNQIKLIEQAGGLHDQIVLFLESFDNIGSRLNQANVAFEEAQGRLLTNKGNVIKRTEDLKKLGARVKKEIDKNLLEEALQNHERALLDVVESEEE